MQGNEYPLDELLPFLASRGGAELPYPDRPGPDGDSFAFIFCTRGPAPESGSNPQNI